MSRNTIDGGKSRKCAAVSSALEGEQRLGISFQHTSSLLVVVELDDVLDVSKGRRSPKSTYLRA